MEIIEIALQLIDDKHGAIIYFLSLTVDIYLRKNSAFLIKPILFILSSSHFFRNLEQICKRKYVQHKTITQDEMPEWKIIYGQQIN